MSCLILVGPNLVATTMTDLRPQERHLPGRTDRMANIVDMRHTAPVIGSSGKTGVLRPVRAQLAGSTIRNAAAVKSPPASQELGRGTNFEHVLADRR